MTSGRSPAMHGLIHVVLKHFITSSFGEEKWRAILSEAGLTDQEPTILSLQAHDDATTVKVVSTAASVLDITVEDALRAYGAFFAENAFQGGHLRMLRSMGDSLTEFMRNLNHMHMVLERDMRTAIFPYFKVTSSENQHEFRISMCSARGALLAPLFEGAFPVVASSIYNVRATLMGEAPEKGFHATWVANTMPLVEASPPQTRAAAPVPDWLQALSMWHTALMGTGRCGGPKCCRTSDDNQAEEVDVPEQQTIRSGSTTTVRLNKMTEGLSYVDLEELSKLQALVATSPEPAKVLMRAVRAGEVASSWSTLEKLDTANAFWSTNAGDAIDYARSEPVSLADFFVTHSWAKPADWHAVMGARAMYGDVKATTLKAVATDAAEASGRPWEEVRFWIDKCCIPQRHALLPVCVALLEEFIHRCNGLVVLCTWKYFSRLWCVYEWAAFLAYHDPRDVHLSVEAFLRPGSRALFLEAVENISAKHCECYDEADRQTLLSKVSEYYVSEDAFEQFAKGTAVALMAVAASRMSTNSEADYNAEFLPWVDLAERLGQRRLAQALRFADPVGWKARAFAEADAETNALGAVASGWRQQFAASCQAWIEKDILPVLQELKIQSVKPEVLDSMKVKKNMLSPRAAADASPLPRHSLWHLREA